MTTLSLQPRSTSSCGVASRKLSVSVPSADRFSRLEVLLLSAPCGDEVRGPSTSALSRTVRKKWASKRLAGRMMERGLREFSQRWQRQGFRSTRRNSRHPIGVVVHGREGRQQ